MANICTNELVVHSENADNLIYVNSFCRDHFNITKIFDNYPDLYIDFESDWTFPENIMNKMFENLPDKEDINMECLSIEWGNYYAVFNVCNSKGWMLV